MVALICLAVLCLNSRGVDDRPNTADAVKLPNCATCEELPEQWLWDVDKDGQMDFAFSYECMSVVGAGADTPAVCWAYLEPARHEYKGFVRVLHPVQFGARIDSATQFPVWACSVGMANLDCHKPDRWRRSFTAPEGDVLAFRIEAWDADLVGWARIRVDPCKGLITILQIYYAPETKGVTVSEEN